MQKTPLEPVGVAVGVASMPGPGLVLDLGNVNLRLWRRWRSALWILWFHLSLLVSHTLTHIILQFQPYSIPSVCVLYVEYILYSQILCVMFSLSLYTVPTPTTTVVQLPSPSSVEPSRTVVPTATPPTKEPPIVIVTQAGCPALLPSALLLSLLCSITLLQSVL